MSPPQVGTEAAASFSRRTSLGFSRNRGGASRTALALFDQAIVSGSSFLTTVCVGRVCGVYELGNYALAFTFYGFALCAFESLIALPYTVFIHRFQGEENRHYAGNTCAQFVVLSAVGSLGLALIALGSALFGSASGLAHTLAALAASLPMILLINFARRVCLADLSVKTALVVDLSVALLQAGGLASLIATDSLSAVTAFLCTGISTGVVGVVWIYKSRRRFRFNRARIRNDFARNWSFGRWAVAGQLLLVTRGASIPWILAILLGTARTGAFVACETIVLFSNPLLLAVSNILGPQTAQAYANHGRGEVRRLVVRSTVVLAMGALIICGVLMLVGEQLLIALFGESLEGRGTVVSILSLAVLAEAFAIPASNGLWAMEQPRANFVAFFIGLITVLVCASSLIPIGGTVGAAVASLLGRSATAATTCILFHHHTRTKVSSLNLVGTSNSDGLCEIKGTVSAQ